jgi:hypothetical protein
VGISYTGTSSLREEDDSGTKDISGATDHQMMEEAESIQQKCPSLQYRGHHKLSIPSGQKAHCICLGILST